MTADPTDTSAPCVLLFDADAVRRERLRDRLARMGCAVREATTIDAAVASMAETTPDLAVVEAPSLDAGRNLCSRLAENGPRPNILLILEQTASVEHNVQHVRTTCFKAGAVEVLLRPFSDAELWAWLRIHLPRRCIEPRQSQLERNLKLAQALLTEGHRPQLGLLVGSSKAVQRLRREVLDAAASNDHLLLSGPPGCDPETIARAIHQTSPRRGGPFLCWDPGVEQQPDPPQILAGQLALARGGTYFVNRLERMPPAWQAALDALVSALEVDRGRLLCFCAREGVRTQTGRHAQMPLLDRLAPKSIRIPTLAERREDIPALARHFLLDAAQRFGLPLERFSDQALERLQQHSWQGDVRELRRVVEHSAALSREPVVEIPPSLLTSPPVGGYELITLLGSGAMGEVWLGRHKLLARPAAVKLIRPRAGGQPAEEVCRRFEREARATAHLNSPNTVKLFDFGITSDGTFYLVMELLDGIDLSTLVQRFGPLPPERTVHLLLQAARALAEAHEAGLVHRDIKPANLFACQAGIDVDVLKILDFGIVKVSGDVTQSADDNGFVGTPRFMAPEALVGNRPIDARADLYALGCVGYWLLAGREPFAATTLEALIAEKAAASLDPLEGAVPPELQAILRSCLAPDREDRPASARELWRRLAGVPLTDAWTMARAETWWRGQMMTIGGVPLP